jgi:hypothetical protein
MEKYISLKEAAKIFGYSGDYLSYLIRKGKIKGKRISSKPSLQTTREAILEYKEKREGRDGTLKDKYSGIDLNQWISLEEAARISGYHPDYIGWLIRKGKIKGRKIYSDYSWLTTKESIKKYQRELEKSKPKFVRIHHLLSKTFSISWRSLYAAFIIFILISELFPAQFFQAAIANITGKETKTIEIYSKLTSGDWQNSEKAKGLPDLKPDADFDLFSETNSAVYKNGSQSLIFENFDAGDFENFDFQSARIKFSFAIGEKKSDIKIINVQPVISNQEPVTNEEQTSSENILPEEPSSFWQRIKKFFVGLGEKLVMAVKKLVKGAIELVEAEELPENISTNTISDLDAKIVIWWSLDGENWQKLKTISDYPLSNKLNGGYFELEAPFLKSFDDVKNLKIKFEGVIGGETNLVAYLDSVWVEAEYQQMVSSEQSKATNNEQLNTTSSEQSKEVATTSEATTTEATTTEATSTQATTTATSTIEKIKPKIKIKDNSLLFNLFKKSFQADEEPIFEIEEPKANLKELIDTGKGEIIEGEIISPEVSTTSTATSTEATTTEATSNISLSILEEATTTESTTTQSEITTTTESTTTEATTTEIKFTPVLKVKIFDPQRIESQIQPEILSQKADGKEKFEIKLPKERNFKPGKWKMEIELETEEAIFVTEQDFTWGVLAINTNKSIYTANNYTASNEQYATSNEQGSEKVYIQMAALRDDGHTICDARLRLQILNPKSEILNLSTEDGTIQKSGECGPDNVTNKPDYFAYYPIVEADGTPAENADKTLMPGIYQMKLTNLDNGYEIEDSFEVRDSVPFDVERIGPTRIYPPAAYEMKMIIKVNQDFEGKVIETVPANFEILEADSTLIKNADNTPMSASNQLSALDQRTNQRLSASINTENATKQIIWEVTWKAGEEYELRYQFDAPDVSPYLYLLGPLEFYQHQSAIFAEQRQWQIAADAPDVLTNSPSTTTGGWTNPTGAYADGGASTSITSAKPSATQTYYGYGFNIPSGATITKVRVRLDAWTTVNEYIELQVSADGGTTWVPATPWRSAALSTTEQTLWVDVTGYATWTPAAVNQIQTRVDAYSNGAASTVYLDWIPVEVTYTPPAPTLNQRSFVWQNDDGTNVNNNTTSTAPDTSLTMEKGERAVFRVQIDNTGTGATTTTFNLQWATTTGTCTTSLTWNNVTANSEISWSYGLSGNNGDALTTSSCAANSNTWTNGKWFEATSTTGSFTLTNGYYTEFGFMIQTANAIAGTTYCLRLNNNGQALNNYYKFGQLSIVSSPTKRYSKDAVSSLPSTTTDLTYYLDNKGYSNVTSDDSVYDPITSSSSIPVFLFAKKNTNNTDAINITWNGQSTVAPSSATVTMEIWNGSSWEQVASNNSAGANTDFTLSGTKSGTNYYNGSYWVYVRVYQASGTQTLKTDYISITFAALITISGTVYTDEGSTPIGSGRTVRIKVNGAGDYSTSTDANGNYSIPVIIDAVGDVVTVFLDGATEKAVTVTRASSTSANITGLNLYQNRIIVRHEDSGPITIADLDKYDSEQDPDILFTASSTAGTLTASSTSEFFIWTGKTFGAWGTGGAGGTISLADVDIRGTFTATSSQTIFVSGNWDATTTAVFNSASSTVTFTATTGKTIRTNGKAFWNLTFNGSGGVWTFLDAATMTNDLQILAGTASSTYDMRVYGGDITGDGILNWTGGTFYLAGTGYFGGTNPWNFNNLTFGTGSAGTTTCTSTNSITVSSDLTVSSNHTLTGSKSFTVNGGDATGDGVINLTGGTFLLDGTGNFGGASNWSFYNLTFGDGVGAATTNKTGNGNITVSNVLTISANQTLNASSQTWTLSGGGTPFVINGTFNSQTSTFKYTATVNATITAATYYNLELSPSGGGGGGSGSQGPNSPSAATNDSSTGTISWVNPNNVFTSDNSYATAGLIGFQTTYYLKATGFGFNIPSGSTINGIVVDVERHAGAAGYILDNAIRIVKNNSVVGDEKASVDYWETSDAYYSYGSATDLWGTSWTVDDINSTGFGVAVSAFNEGSIETVTAYIDHIRITVYYTSGAAPTYTLGSGTFTINGTTTIGDGTNGVSVTADTNDPVLDVNGNFTISANATFIASNSATSTFAGNWSNSGTFTHSNGTIIFDATLTGKTIKTGGSPFYNLTFNGSGGGWTFLDVATTSNNFTILNGTVTATSTLYVCGDWLATTTGIFQHNNGEVIFCATTPGHKISDGGWPFYKLTFNGSGGEWLYQDSTSTAPATTTVIAGIPTFLNAKTGNVSVSGGTLNVDWYLGIHVVAGDSTSTNLDTGDNDITISEASGSSTVWKMSSGSWGTPASSKTTGTGSDGKNPQPNSDGAIRIREYSRTASGAAYYKYNLQIASQPGFSAYNYYSDYGGKYIASVSSTDSDVDLAISQDWHRSIPSQMNGSPDYDGLNEPPLHGSWYCGMHSDLEFSVDSVSVNLGSLYELNSWTATGTTILSVTTSYPGGYTVKAHMEPTLGRLKMTYNSNDYWIIRWPYANSTPAVWDGNCINNGQCGFGYRTSDYNLQGPGASDRFATSTVYAGFATSSTAADPVADSTNSVSGATTTITYKVSVSNLQESGTYSGTVYYICTVNY